MTTYFHDASGGDESQKKGSKNRDYKQTHSE